MTAAVEYLSMAVELDQLAATLETTNLRAYARYCSGIAERASRAEQANPVPGPDPWCTCASCASYMFRVRWEHHVGRRDTL